MKKKLKILFIEDSEDDALLILKNICQDGFDPTYERVDTSQELETALESKDWDIVLSDYNMPNFSGLDALKIFKKKNLEIPFIIISGTIGEDLAVETMKRGANDYLMKDKLARLVPSIKREIKEAKIRKENKEFLIEKNKAKEELIEKSNQLKTLMEYTPEYIFIKNKDSEYILNNNTHKELLGILNKEEIKGKTDFYFYPRKEANKYFSQEQKIIKTGEPIFNKQEQIYSEAKKRKIWIEFSKVPLKDNSGRINGIVGTAKDITERKKAEEVILQSEERLKSFMNSATELFSIWDSKINLLELNKAATKMFSQGFKKKEILGKNISDLISGVKKSGNYDKYLEVIRTGKPFYHEETTQPQFGSKYLAIKAFKVGKGLGMLTTDITERKKSEKEINNLAKFPSENPNPVIRIDFKGKIIFVNEVCKKKLKDWKCKKGNFIPDPIYDLVKNNLKDKTQTIDITSGKNIYEFYIIPFKEEGYINLYGRDITGRKLAEDKLNKSYIKLQKTLNSTINALASIVEIRDPYTSGHQKRVTFLAISISEELGLDKVKIENVGIAALIHDIGKITVPASILSKPGEISDIEYELIKKHPKTGYDIIKNIEFPNSIEEIVIQHHERLNGSGYPKGLKNKNIIQEAKILAIADVVEAMSSHRPYRPSLGMNKALEEIKKGKKKLYDPKMVDACIRIVKEKKFKF